MMAETEEDLLGSLWTGDTDNQNSNSSNESDSEEEDTPVSEGKNTTRKKGRLRAVPKKRRTDKPQPRQNKVVCSVESCNYSTPYPKDLIRHMRKHTGEKPFSCDICAKSFSRHDKLVGHKRTHDLDGVKPNKCNVCDYSSLDAGSLRKHMRVHTDERPYQCQMCSYRARDSSQLIVHLRHHTGDCPYTCSYKNCQASFKTPSDLTRHSRRHTGEKPHSCTECDYRAAVKSNLNAHIKKYHNDVTPNPNSNGSSQNSNSNDTSGCISGNAELKSYSRHVGKLIGRNNRSRDPHDFQFACKQCDYKGETIKHFEQHMRRKHKVGKKAVVPVPNTRIMPPPKKRNLKEYYRIFSCSTCSASFVREDSLRCHVKQHASLGPPPMPIIPVIETPQVHNLAVYEAPLVSLVPPYLTNLGESEHLNQVQVEEFVENVCVRPQVITFADRTFTEN